MASSEEEETLVRRESAAEAVFPMAPVAGAICKKESSLSTTYWSESTLSPSWLGGPATRHESLNSVRRESAAEALLPTAPVAGTICNTSLDYLRIVVYLVIYDSG